MELHQRAAVPGRAAAVGNGLVPTGDFPPDGDDSRQFPGPADDGYDDDFFNARRFQHQHPGVGLRSLEDIEQTLISVTRDLRSLLPTTKLLIGNHGT